MPWFEMHMLATGPAIIFTFGGWLAYDANRWRWHRSTCEAEREVPPRTDRRG